jgi:hypothetical protein
MQNLDPTYLRYIYDGLIKGSIHSENESELPEGLIGMYEESFEENIPVMHRQKLLKRFALFALLKKEVSISFVAEVLEESENDILEFINTYASWFNSPEIGKYQLYHERLKVYVLQKLSEKEIHTIQEKVIARLEQAIEEQKADEFERYALEFLNKHLFDISMISGDGIKLIYLSSSQTHWQRQLKISKGYTWTKNGLKVAMVWAYKYSDDYVIEFGLYMLDLHAQELNDAKKILDFVSNNEINLALERITNIGFENNEVIHIKFIIYLFSLIELSHCEFEKESAKIDELKKIVQHFDEKLVEDVNILNWNDFFPSYIVFQIACSLKFIGIDFQQIFKHTNDLSIAWLPEKGPYSDFQIDTMIQCVNYVNYTWNTRWKKIYLLKEILSQLLVQGNMKYYEKLLTFIDSEFKPLNIKINNDSEFISNLENSLSHEEINIDLYGIKKIALNIDNQNFAKFIFIDFLDKIISLKKDKLPNQDDFLNLISSNFIEQRQIQNAIKYTLLITNEKKKCKILVHLITVLFDKNYDCNSIIELSVKFKNIFIQVDLLMSVSNLFFNIGRKKEAELLLNYSLNLSNNIELDSEKISLKKVISTALHKIGKNEESFSLMSEAIEIARNVSFEMQKNISLAELSTELSVQGELKLSSSLFKEAHRFTTQISNPYLQSILLNNLSIELINQGYITKSLTLINKISCNYNKSIVLKEYSKALVENSKIIDALSIARNIIEVDNKDLALSYVAKRLFLDGDFAFSEKVSDEIKRLNQRHICWKEIAKEILEKNELFTSLEGFLFLKSEEIGLQYLKGIAENIGGKIITVEFIKKFLIYSDYDLESMKLVICSYFYYQILFNEKITVQKIAHENNNLNLQWAIDLKKELDQLPN